MDNLPTTRPGETPRARADEFCVHSPPAAGVTLYATTMNDRREGKNRRQHRRAQIQRAWTREGWRQAEVRLEQRQAARWQDKGHNKWMATRRAKKVGGRRHRKRTTTTTTAMFNLNINDEDGERAVARSKTSGLAATASQAAAGAGSDDSRRRDDDSSGCVPASLCGQQVRVAGCWWGRGPRYRLGGGGKRGWVT